MTTTAATTLDDITRRAEALATARQRLAELVGALNAGIEALKNEQMPELRQAVAAAEQAWNAMSADIEANVHLFVRPRTVVAHGIKFGLQKGQGAIDIPDPARTVQLIEKHFPEQASVLIDVTKTPAKAAIAQLPAADLKRIGAHVVAATDQVLIKPADGQVDKLVKALVKAAIEEAKA